MMSVAPVVRTAAVEVLATRIATEPRSLLRNLEVGLVCATVAVMARVALDPLLGEHLPFSIFFPALVTAALWGGEAAAVLALCVTTICGWFLFLPPQLSFDIAAGKGLQIPVFVCLGAFTIGLGLVLRRALLRLELHRRRHEALLRELNERLQKDLGLVAQMVRDSSREDGGRPRSHERLADRVQVLREAHHDLSSLDWGPISVRHVVSRPIRYLPADEAGRISQEGPDVSLDSDLAVALALCIWELADRAHLGGALSEPDGRVRISWLKDGHVVRFSWTESDCEHARPVTSLLPRLLSDRLAWRVERSPGLVAWTVSLEARQSEVDTPHRALRRPRAA